MDLMIPDSGLLFWMLVSFAILFFVLAKFGWPVITGMVERRKERIDRSLEEAAKARELLATLKQQSDQLVEEAQRQQSEVIARTAQMRTQLLDEARSAAQEEGRKILEQSRLQAQAEREAMLQEIRSYVALLSVEVAEKILKDKLAAPEDQTELINRYIDDTIKGNGK